MAGLLLITFVISVCLGVARLDLQLGLLTTLLTIPALMRTAVVAARKTAAGAPPRSRDWILEFLFSWVITFPVTIVALVAASFTMLLLLLVDRYATVPAELFVGASVSAALLVFFLGIRASLAYGPAKESERPRRYLPRHLPPLSLAETPCYPPLMFYTPAMIAELASVPLATVRAWQRRGWLVAREVEHGVASFDFAEVTIARTLAQLQQAGIKPSQLEKKLQQIGAHFPHVRRPLAELTFLVEGRQVLVRQGGEILEPRGQLRMDFGALEVEESEEPALLSPLARPGESAEELVRRGQGFEEAGHLAAAADAYRSALAAGGPRAAICFALAEVLYRLGDLPAARERYFMAIELDEDHAEARANLGCLLAELGEGELAVAALQGAIACHGEYADAHFHLARLLDEQGRSDDAAEHWREYLRLAPESPWREEARARLGI